MLNLFVSDAKTGAKIQAQVSPATANDFAQTQNWQTSWQTVTTATMPNKVALRRTDDGELLGLMSYAVHNDALMVEIVYIESAQHSNANVIAKEEKKYIGIAKALFAYAADVSVKKAAMVFWYLKLRPLNWSTTTFVSLAPVTPVSMTHSD